MARKRRERNRGLTPRPGAVPSKPVWKWRTVPVLLAVTGGFTLGWYVAAIGAGQTPGGGAYIILLVVMLGFALGLSRITSYWTAVWIARRRQKSGDLAPAATDRVARKRRA